MNIKEIKEIIELMKENNLREFEMERDGLRISLKRGLKGEPEIVTVTQPQQIVAEKSVVPQEIVPPPEEDNITQIVSPMVGTFYSASAPDVAPYVVLGQEVDPDNVVCIIEAMKVMNEIKAEVKGRIKEILVKSGEPVEFGQVLFVVEKL